MKLLTTITKASMQSALAYRVWMITMSLSNLMYILIVYFLWQAIYEGSESLNGLSFEDSFLYLSLAGTLFATFMTFTDFGISSDIRSGQVMVDMIRPVTYQSVLFSSVLGFALMNILFIVIPAWLLVVFVLGMHLPLHPMLLVAPFMIAVAYLLSFLIDFMVGTIAFYTESIWGVITAKETIVMALSGVIVPFVFFPEALQAWLAWTPFVAIFHAPVSVLLGHVDSWPELWPLLANQLLWLVVAYALSQLFFKRASRILTVNGG